MAGVPRKPSDSFDPWAGWEISARNPFLPVGEYTNEAGDVSAGFAMPSIVTEPANALARLLNTPSGTMPNPQNPEMKQDALTGLLSLYGGNAMSGMARGAGRNALATKALSDTGKPSPVRAGVGRISKEIDGDNWAYQWTNKDGKEFTAHGRRWSPTRVNEERRYENAIRTKKGLPELLPVDKSYVEVSGISPQVASKKYAPEHRGTHGRALLRELQEELLKDYPDIGGYFGNRVSGSRRASSMTDRQWVDGLFSDTGKPSPVGSAIASSAGEKAKGARPEPSALLPKAEAMGASLAETDLSKLAEEAYVKAYRADVDANKHRYFNDWADDPKNPIVADDWGRQIGGSEISESYDNATPFGNRSLLETHPAVANALSDAAAAIGRELYMVPSGSGSSYGQLRTPSGNSYRVRVADHANTSSLHDAPDFNIAPGALSPEEFINLLPTLLSDTGRPSIMGSAIASGAEPKGITAYHGSPHDFDKFDMSKIGTGEGAQAYGHGLYFAENERVAKAYRDQLVAPQRYHDDLSPNELNVVDDAISILKSSGGDRLAAAGSAKKKAEAKASIWNMYDPEREKWLTVSNMLEDEGKAKSLSSLGAKIAEGKKGHMYEVRINANPNDFLDWDKPLSQQSEKIRNALSGAAQKEAERIMASDRLQASKAEQMGMKWSAPKDVDPMSMRGADLWDRIPDDAGIPGVRYLDQMSREAGDGSYNYSVNDASLIEILRKYGWLPPAIGAGAMAQDQGQDIPPWFLGLDERVTY